MRSALDRDSSSALDLDGAWEERPQALDWSCRETLVHVVRCLTNYGALLARQASGPVAVPLMSEEVTVVELLDAVHSTSCVLSMVVAASSSTARAWHPAGTSDASGFAAMACDELLVHAADIAAVLCVEFQPSAPLCDRVLRRLFPWAPPAVDPWRGLLWANGRGFLDDLPPDPDWLWHCAPLEEWDGNVRRVS